MSGLPLLHLPLLRAYAGLNQLSFPAAWVAVPNSQLVALLSLLLLSLTGGVWLGYRARTQSLLRREQQLLHTAQHLQEVANNLQKVADKLGIEIQVVAQAATTRAQDDDPENTPFTFSAN